MIRGIVFDIKRYSIHDGPGIRTTFFLKGCPLSCWWCHNPEGMSHRPILIRHPNRCIGCGRCTVSCPTGAWDRTADGQLRRDKGKCILCGKCAEVCPPAAIEIAGREMTPAEVVLEAKKDIPFYDESGGGVTFSGGEPLFQSSFLVACLLRLQEAEVHTAVDTSGYCEESKILEAAEIADLFLFDIKHVDPKKHEYYTGVSNSIILSNLEKLDEVLVRRGRGRINIRMPLIPGINDDPHNLEAVAELSASLKTLSGVNILPYHSTGEGKYRNLGMEYKMGKYLPPREDKIAEALDIFRRQGIEAVKGG
ncbi:glycyl-radical enzyme activating protein [Aminivibrio sp.]|uniref:glycyl-radical enzyme activating protein n=1 Tax=Aminivibrio sp. TaxID=1872489 RepID=UPI001A421E39|nr:glycyl-radical enzyme activating protein [Aminivibrio sp.]MBL3538636.1 glycyl-radical enzyme activating protein [Aminivibrio sp.]